MQIQIVRHDGGAKNADGQIEHVAVMQQAQRREQARGGFTPERLGEEKFVGEAGGDGGDQRDHQRFDPAEAAALQRQHQENVRAGDQNAGQKRDAEKELQRDRRAQDFRQIAGGNGDFAQEPQGQRDGARVGFAAELRQVASGGDAQLGGERLNENCQQAAENDDAQERVAEFASRRRCRWPSFLGPCSRRPRDNPDRRRAKACAGRRRCWKWERCGIPRAKRAGKRATAWRARREAPRPGRRRQRRPIRCCPRRQESPGMGFTVMLKRS